MSFSERDYSLLAVNICKSREERKREEKSTKLGASVTATLAKKVVKKIKSMLRSRSRYARRKSTLVFNYSTYSSTDILHFGEMEEAQCKFGGEQPPRFCPDLSASSRRNC